jgi:hypothetical protein
MSRLITDLDNYKEMLQKTESRLGKRVKDLTAQLNTKVNIQVALKSDKIYIFDLFSKSPRKLRTYESL